MESQAEDAERRAAEHLALGAIYPDFVGDASGDEPWRVPLDVGNAVLELHMPLDYPSCSPPTPLLHGDFITDAQRTRLVSELMEIYCGDEVIFAWVEHLRDALASDAAEDGSLSAALAAAELDDAATYDDTALAEAVAAACADDEADATAEAAAHRAATNRDAAGFTFTPASARYGQRVRHFDAAASDDARFGVEITRGASFHPPKGGPSEEFVAHVASVHSMEQVNWVLATLLQDKRVARATHNMIAYRFVDARGVQVSDTDDDGESGAGAKLGALLELTSARNVLVVVSRWFGGVLLGPARFKHIASVARQLLEETGHVASGGGKESTKGGGRK